MATITEELDAAEAIPEGGIPSLDDYWQVTLVGNDWQRMFGIWLAAESDKAVFKPGEVYQGYHKGSQDPVFWLRKDRFPAEVVAPRFGITPEALTEGRYLTAYPTEGMNEDALATVPGFGRA